MSKRALLRDESGFTLIEVLVSLAILALVLGGAVTASTAFKGKSLESRVRTNASALASDMVEKARALSYGDLKINDPTDATDPNFGQVPATYNDGGTNYNVIRASGCPACIPYLQTVSRNGITFSVKQLVLDLESYSDSTNAVQRLKKLIVEVSWTTPSAGKTVLHTIVNNQDYLNGPDLTGVHIEVRDDSSGDGNIIDDPNLQWTISIKNLSTNATITDTTTEGVYENTKALPAGNYSCTITRASTTQGYYPKGDATQAATNQACGAYSNSSGSAGTNFTVNAGEVTNLVNRWTHSTACAYSGTNGTVKITVTTSDGDPLQGATVTLKGTNSKNPATNNPVTLTTDASGLASYAGDADTYTYSATKSFYVDNPGGSLCNYATGVSFATMALDAVSASTMTLNVAVTNQSGANQTFKVELIGTWSGPPTVDSVQSLTVNKNQQGTTTFAGAPTGIYNVTVCRVVSSTSCSGFAQWTNQDFTSPGTTYSLATTYTG